MSTALETFFKTWSMEDAAARLKDVQSVLSSNAIYIDPRTPDPLRGPEAIAGYIGMFAQMAPGATASVVATQTQHSIIRATIAFRMPDGMEQMGQYFVDIDEDDHITRMVGFVGIGTPE